MTVLVWVTLSIVTLCLMNSFDVPWDIAGLTASFLMLWALTLGVWCWFNNSYDLAYTHYGLPYAGALLVPAFSPVINYIAGVREISDLFDHDGLRVNYGAIAWYGTFWSQALLFVAILLVGYSLIYWRREY